ncbi:helix-turn-helix domain-containing protein [Streptococcus sp. zg-86]|uniref:Helix-turn-helix domain-containing protein n=1 Tax=Streptococcus zhangguiae TaxID=2664091 RepID=A0A6I4RMW8_9STRE|nr:MULTISPECIES: Rgg/GadR/MutR family transcriptional regulator [unclassified Streptococcus]MTB63557.1 helix-turn-helix domain-containing protein [Streptococcus sp. zg-86]MTB89794.1 helix-turn-helix domain-containing protein [Streptococcus sp. zg-36]MWV55465.1 helix-turn-helix domain-containing protein [Streptococcus sp. zg-70]QTH47657.1 helix-turn-helix domain-containing protein [Streptococcus sp. zg-86]
MNHFGKTFKFIREGKGLSLATVAKNHVSTSQLSRFENGESDITVQKLIQVLEEMNVSLNEFIHACQDFKEDEFSRMIGQLKIHVYNRDSMRMKQLLSEQLMKVELGIHEEFHRINAILIKCKLKEIEKTVFVTAEEITYLTDYLFRIENWGYYELRLFANIMENLSHRYLMLCCRELVARTEFYSELHEYKLLLSQILLNGYLICIERSKFIEAVFFEKMIASHFFDETDIFNRLLFHYCKGYYKYKKDKDVNGILEMRKCIGLLRSVDSHHLANWYEKMLENIPNK